MIFSQWFSGSFAPLGRLKQPHDSSSGRPRSREEAQRQKTNRASSAVNTCSASTPAALTVCSAPLMSGRERPAKKPPIAPES